MSEVNINVYDGDGTLCLEPRQEHWALDGRVPMSHVDFKMLLYLLFWSLFFV